MWIKISLCTHWSNGGEGTKDLAMNVVDVCKKNNLKVKTSTICCYPTNKNFIQAHKDEILKTMATLSNELMPKL